MLLEKFPWQQRTIKTDVESLQGPHRDNLIMTDVNDSWDAPNICSSQNPGDECAWWNGCASEGKAVSKLRINWHLLRTRKKMLSDFLFLRHYIGWIIRNKWRKIIFEKNIFYYFILCHLYSTPGPLLLLLFLKKALIGKNIFFHSPVFIF